MNTLSKNLKLLMGKNHIRMANLSRETGISSSVINRLANGITTNPNVDTLRPIANYFSISISQLVGDQKILERNPRCTVAVISWNNLSEWQQNQPQQIIIDHIYTEYSLPKHAFAVRLENSSMAPKFMKGSLLVVNPDTKAQDHDHVIVHLNHQKNPLFKKILFDGDTAYLNSYHQDIRTITINKDVKIVGVVVETRLLL